MPSPIKQIDRAVLEALSGPEKIKALLKSRGLTIKGFAQKHQEWPVSVSRCIHGERPHPEVREKLATELGYSREQIDALIEEGDRE